MKSMQDEKKNSNQEKIYWQMFLLLSPKERKKQRMINIKTKHLSNSFGYSEVLNKNILFFGVPGNRDYEARECIRIQKAVKR